MGKSKPKDASKQQDLPKYMCLNGSTQYELAESIDAAMANADREVKADQEQEALLLWYEQILDGIHETFLLQKGVRSIPNNDVMVSVIIGLLPLCWVYYQSNMDYHPEKGIGRKADFQLLMTRLLEHSFTNALDILHARNLWRFDIQRNMQQGQKVMIQAVQQYIKLRQ
jgi:hypothetical protein